MATYKITNNCLLFFSAKFFLDSINTLFQFRFVETKDNKWVLEFRLIDELIWQRKPISICLTNNHVEVDPLYDFKIVNNDNNVEEDIHLLKTYYILHELLVEALNKPDLILPEHKVSVTDIKLFAPYHFEVSKFPSWEKQPGQTTLRISNAGYKNNSANIYLAFNNWKYIQIAKHETPIKKRKLEPEDTHEPVSVLSATECQECQIVCEP